MIEMIFIVLCSVVFGTFFIAVVSLITLADLKTIQLENELRRHPHARKWRGVTKLRKTMKLSDNARFISPKAERFALAKFQSEPSTRFVEIIPRLEFPETIRDFFAAYHEIALTPFIRVRAAANIKSPRTLWPTLVRKKQHAGRLDKWYDTYVWLLSVMNLALFVYVSSVALSADQPDFLMAYMSAFGLWLAWSITNHPLLVWRQKLAYLFLAPASFGYFLWRVFAAPFAPLRKIPLYSTLRRVLS